MVDVSFERCVRWLVLSLVLTAGTVMATPPVSAQPSKDEVETFKRLVATGSNHYQNEEFEQALETFREAQEIANPPSLRYNVARTLQSLGRCGDAKDELESFLSVDDLSDTKRRKGQQRLNELRDECSASVTITCQPKEAEATVDIDGNRQACPAGFTLDPGEYAVRVTASGYDTETRQVTLAAGETRSQEVTLSEESDDSESGGSRAGGGIVAQIGGLAVGAGLLGGGVVSDLGANARLRDLQEASEANDAEEVQRLQREADGARIRTIALYAGGAALTLGSAIWMTVDLASDSPSDEGVALQFQVSPRSITGSVRW